MLTLALVLLIFLGIILIILEILVLPGITVAGVGGTVLMVMGVVMSYKTYGFAIGNYTLLFSVVALVLSIVLSLKSKTWNKFALHTEINSKVTVLPTSNLKIGEVGFALTKLATIGKAQFGEIVVDAQSTGGYIAENTSIEIVKINDSNIIVKPLI
jgi:membrane-bound ClpP family serine protease